MQHDLSMYTDQDGNLTSKDKHRGGTGSLRNFNPETDRALAYTNKRVGELNAEIAEILGLPVHYRDLEPLVANAVHCSYSIDIGEMTIYPNCIVKARLMEDRKLEDTIAKTNSDIEKYSTDLSDYDQGTIEIDNTLYNIYYDTDHYKTLQKLKQGVDKAQTYVYQNNTIPKETNLAKWCGANRQAKGVRERGRAWSRYIAHQNLVFNLQRPFATTVHKAQGNEFDTVYIAQEDIKKSIRNGYYETYARLSYVALSRAIKGVVIV